MDSARLSTSKGALPRRLSTVRGQESVTQKKANGPSLPSVSSIASREMVGVLAILPGSWWAKRSHDLLGNTACVTYALTLAAP